MISPDERLRTNPNSCNTSSPPSEVSKRDDYAYSSVLRVSVNIGAAVDVQNYTRKWMER